MTLPFNGSKDLTLGVEIELQLLNPTTLDLTPKSDEILQACRTRGINHVKAEVHQSMLEIDTPICQTVPQCRESLSTSIRTIQEIGNAADLFLSISGTHPFQQWSERLIYPSERYKYLASKFQWLIRRMNVYGMHVHIGVKDGDTGIKLLNGLVAYLPLFLALSASSPFWQGIDTGFHSCRSGIIESFPYSGVPPHFNNWAEFENYYHTLIRAGAITSTKDLYWLVRPNAQFGTIEIRIFDGMPTITEMMSLVALTQCIAKEILDDSAKKEDSYSHWIAPANILAAARDGLKGIISTDKSGTKKAISQQVLSCLERLWNVAQDLGCLEELSLIKTILENGSSSQRQRQIFAKTNNLRDVVESVISEFQKN